MDPDFDPTNVQGDILFGINKYAQMFYFFKIEDSESYGKRLAEFISSIKRVEDLGCFEQGMEGFGPIPTGPIPTGPLGELIKNFDDHHQTDFALDFARFVLGEVGAGGVDDPLPLPEKLPRGLAEKLAKYISGAESTDEQVACFLRRLCQAGIRTGTSAERIEDLVELFTRYLPGPASGKYVGLMRDKNKDYKSKSGTLRTTCAINIAFSSQGLKKMTTDLGGLEADARFMDGQQSIAQNLGDNLSDWDNAFKDRKIDGVMLIAGDSKETVEERLEEIKEYFEKPTKSTTEIASLLGEVRPGKFRGFEHFGWRDGISQPRFKGYNVPYPGPDPVDSGIILLGHEGDLHKDKRQGVLEKEGSFLVFRRLSQKVPEFHEFLKKHPIKTLGLTDEEGSELLGARLVGRWKTGAPVNMTPFRDYAELMEDPNRINNFSYAAEEEFQKLCPFASHIRSANPRINSPDGLRSDVNRIMRRGVPFGRDDDEERGLLFVAYQANIQRGFMKQQTDWANNLTYPPRAPRDPLPGVDALIGQNPKGRSLSGYHPDRPSDVLQDIPTFIVSHGGEFFFSPSIKGLEYIAKEAQKLKAT